jgi:hypothetical protein
MMNQRSQVSVAALLLLALAAVVAAQSVYPTRTTIYDPSRAWSGYTVLSPLNTQAVIVIDMNGNVVKQWDGYINSAGGPARIFPNGVVMAANGTNAPRQESLDIQRDEGHVLWRFGHQEIRRVVAPQSGRASITTGSGKIFRRATIRRVSRLESRQQDADLTHTNHTRPNVANVSLETIAS